MEAMVVNANRHVHKGDYTTATKIFNRILDDSAHPAAYLNRALCHTAMGQPHLAANDALRAYMMAQAVLDVVYARATVNSVIQRTFRQVEAYANECIGAISREESWCEASTSADIFHAELQGLELTKMTLDDRLPDEDDKAKDDKIPFAVFDLKHKAIFRLANALSKCGAGSSLTALHVLEDSINVNNASSAKQAFSAATVKQLEVLTKTIQDILLNDVVNGKPSTSDYELTKSGFSIFSTSQYGFANKPENYALINNAILTIDPNSIAKFTYRFGRIAPLVATQDVYEGTVLFTERLPFFASTEGTTDASELSETCDCCGADLQIPSPFVLRVLSEEVKQAEAKKSASKAANSNSNEQTTPKPSPYRHRRTFASDAASCQFAPPGRVDSLVGGETQNAKASSDAKGGDQNTGKEDGEVSDDSGSASDDDDDDDIDDDDDDDAFLDSPESSEVESDASSECSAPDTPARGKAHPRADLFETADIQVCRYGNEKLRENLSFCSPECYDLALSSYHDSICGSHIETYLNGSVMTKEHPELPKVHIRKLTLMLLVRILGWAYTTSTDPLDLHVVQLMLVSRQYPLLQEKASVTWSFHNNVLRPFQMFQAMDGRTDAPKSVRNPNYTDGRVINTLISLIERHLKITQKINWTKTYDEEGYYEQTLRFSPEAQNDDEGDDDVFYGRLHPLCDLVPLACSHDPANVELVDLGDGRIVCLPIFPTTTTFAGDTADCIRAGTPLFLRSAEPRFATSDERAAYARKVDYGEGGTMMDDDDEEDGVHYEEEEEEHSGYIDEEFYGAIGSDDEIMEDFDEDDMDVDF